MAGDEKKASSGSGRKRSVVVFYMLFLMTLAFTLWQAYLYFSREDVSSGRNLSPVDSSISKSSPHGKKLLPQLMEDGKIAGLDFSIDQQPPVEPPDGAKIIFAVGRKGRRKGWVKLQWFYSCKGEYEQLNEYYLKGMKAAGYTLISIGKRMRNRRVITFKNGQLISQIILRFSRKEGKMVKNIAVICSRPRSPEAPG